jgi:predicted DCC family thiol-disulfide oxidoreductase YuxK
VILILDGTCGFCQQCALWIERRLRGPLTFRANQTVSDDELARWSLTRQNLVEAVCVVDGATTYQGSRAVAAALRQCRAGWPLLGRFIAFPGITIASEAIYRTVARNRHRLPGSTCGIGQNSTEE